MNTKKTKDVYDWGDDTLGDEEAIETSKLGAKDLLKFGKQILVWLAILFAASAISEIFYPGNAVYETSKTVLPSIATLVIGYYFGSSSQ